MVFFTKYYSLFYLCRFRASIKTFA
uniref:N protein of photosystem II n=1 Tax=Uronema sp. FACHB-2429 TaxID=2725787 RepID=A0A6H1U8G2_9CHLO|nr:N protein of photosystem II [Uronema sp. FACHB-2429]